MIETIVMFPMFFGAVMSFVQLAYLEVGTLTTQHAATEAARAASVILADDPQYYDSAVGHATGTRLEEITEAARTPLRVTSLDPKVRVRLPEGKTYRAGDAVHVVVELEQPCTIPVGGLVCCGLSRKRILRREATMPYQGAGYTYR